MGELWGLGGGRGYSFRRGRRPLSASEIAEQPEEGDIAFCPWDSKGKQTQGPDMPSIVSRQRWRFFNPGLPVARNQALVRGGMYPRCFLF